MVPAGGSNSSVIMDPALGASAPEEAAGSFETTHKVGATIHTSDEALVTA
jgi:hypothetical protein